MSATKRGLCAAGVFAVFSLLAVLAMHPASMEPAMPDDPLQMVLIDIGDEQAAASYHVDQLGVYVLAAGEGGEAYAAGVRAGDRLVMVDGMAVATTQEFARLQEAFCPGQQVQLSLRRGAENLPIVAEILWEAPASD